MPKPLRTRPVSTALVRAYAGKAQEYADAAVAELTAGRYIAAWVLEWVGHSPKDPRAYWTLHLNDIDDTKGSITPLSWTFLAH